MGSRKPVDTLASGIIPGKYIIELEPGSTLKSRDVNLSDSPLIGEIQSLGYDASVTQDLTSASGGFQGVSIEVANSENVTLGQLKDVPGVVNAWPVYAVTLDVDFDTNNAAPKWNPHVVTRVEELHKRGIKGKGQRVCVIDSGADASHPVLAGRIAGGKNMLDDSTNIEDCNGHGTFVSSVIVGQSKDLTGVAPESEVFMYKVFGCESTTSNDIVLKGLLAADADDCDIVSLSLGVDNGYSGSVMSRVASEVAQRRLVLVAAGNSGEQGTFYASSPASGHGVVAVASVNSKQVLGWPATIQSSAGESLEIRYVTPDGQKLNESTSAQLSFDEGDSCNPTLYGSEDEAVIIKRGICFSNKAYNYLSSTGFGYFLIFDSYNQGVFYDSELNGMISPSIHLFAVTEASVGTWVSKQISAGHNLTLKVEPDADAVVSEADFPSGGQLSAFSSWGLTFENDFSPSIAAPGGAVYGAFPDNRHAIASGTSFSTPYVAGVAALFFSHVNKDHKDFFRRISSTAALLPSYDVAQKETYSDIAPLAQQGAGLIDAVKMMDYKTLLVSEPHLSLNDTDNRISTHTIVLRNAGSSPVTYKVSHVAASTAQSRDEYWYPMLYFPPLIDDAKGSINAPDSYCVLCCSRRYPNQIAPDSVTIAPGSTGNVEVTINSPENLESNSGALWSGKIVFEGSNGEFIAVPYMGIEASTYEWTPLEGAPLAFRFDQDTGYLYPVNWQNKPYKPAEFDSPEIYYALRYGTYEFSLDLVGEDWTADDFSYPLTKGASSNDWIGPLRSAPDVFGNFVDFPIEFPLRFSNVGFTRFQSFSNGTAIPSGKYRLLSRALRAFGDPSNAADWQLYLSDVFRVQHGDDPIPGESTTTTASATAFTTSAINSPTDTTTGSPTTSSVPVESTTAVPGITTTLKAIATPVGIPDAVVDLTLARQGVSSRVIETPGDWMELHVQIRIPSRVDEGSVVSFALPPQIVEVAEKEYVMDQASNLVGSASFDEKTGLYSVEFSDWAEWHKDIVGNFYLYCRFSRDFQKELQAGTYVVEMLTVGKTFRPPIFYQSIDRSKVYESKREDVVDGQSVYYFDVELPSQLGPWNSVTVVASQASTDDGFLCTEASVVIGTEFDKQNQIIKSKDITAQALRRCEVKTFRATYSGDVQEGEVLAFNIPNILGIKDSWTISMAYSLQVELKNGTTIGYDYRNLEYSRYSRSRPDAFFSAAVDRPVPPESSTTLIETLSFTTASPIINSTTHGLTSTADVSTSTADGSTSTADGSTSTPGTLSPTANMTISTTTEGPTSSESSVLTTDLQYISETTRSGTGSSSGFTSDEFGTSTTSIDNSSITTSSSETLQTQSDSSKTGSISQETTTSWFGAHSVSSRLSETNIDIPLSTSTNTHSEQVPSYALPGSASTTLGYSISTHTQSVTVITSVCSDSSWPQPVTVTHTVPCVTNHETDVTTVTSVCTQCAEHPVTITYTQPFKATAQSNSDTPFAKTDELHSVSQIHYQAPSVTIPRYGQPPQPINTKTSGNVTFTEVSDSDARLSISLGAPTGSSNLPTWTTSSEPSDGQGEKTSEDGGQKKHVPDTQGDAEKGGKQTKLVTESVSSASTPTVVMVEGASTHLTTSSWGMILVVISSTLFVAFSVTV
ncbi:alkaline elastase [Fusarium albosuccineum]|uniref:Alkaline elastase n=1 Tax=Fusarium albosuccineum TaxID=1237068 RepID=A0A8H4PFG0_9HYPO|nr:alkaline elastase [Fusarium albosuccineum]